MSYHESFWVVAGTAAPVVALAAVVVLPEALNASDVARTRALENYVAKIQEEAARAGVSTSALSALATAVAIASVGIGAYAVTITSRLGKLAAARLLGTYINVFLQAGLLALSLTALAYGRNIVPQWIVIVLAVGGILLLTWTLRLGFALRQALKEAEFDQILKGKSHKPDAADSN